MKELKVEANCTGTQDSIEKLRKKQSGTMENSRKLTGSWKKIPRVISVCWKFKTPKFGEKN